VSFLAQLRHPLGALLLFAVPILACGSVSDADLQREYGGKVLTLRQFYPGGQLHFDATEQAVQHSCAWCVDGRRAIAGTKDFFEKRLGAHPGTTIVPFL
jgi:hypothetical protein